MTELNRTDQFVNNEEDLIEIVDSDSDGDILFPYQSDSSSDEEVEIIRPPNPEPQDVVTIDEPELQQPTPSIMASSNSSDLPNNNQSVPPVIAHLPRENIHFQNVNFGRVNPASSTVVSSPVSSLSSVLSQSRISRNHDLVPSERRPNTVLGYFRNTNVDRSLPSNSQGHSGPNSETASANGSLMPSSSVSLMLSSSVSLVPDAGVMSVPASSVSAVSSVNATLVPTNTPMSVYSAGDVTQSIVSDHSASVTNDSSHTGTTVTSVASASVPHVLTTIPGSSPITSRTSPRPMLTALLGLSPQSTREVRVLVDQNQSINEFRSPKRRKMMSPEYIKSPKKRTPKKEESDDEGDTCPICFELWTTSGIHRLISLKCGHLFGQSCIQKWLKGQGGKCPQCNAKAKRQDIRVLYAKSITALDTTERDRALEDLGNEREAKRKMELETAQLRLKYHQSCEECIALRNETDRLRAEVEVLRCRATGSTSLPISQPLPSYASQRVCSGTFILDKTIPISQEGKCRVLAFSSSLATLLVSQPSNSHLFKGFGVKKISTMDLKTFQYLPIHSNVIRDICFHPLFDDGILLSCGMDKSVKLTSIMSNTVVQTYETPQPVWSCIWNSSNKSYFYAGLSNGSVLEYDTRNTAEAVQEINKEAKRAPVVSLQYIPKDETASFKPEGLLVGQLDQTSFYEKISENELKLHLLPLDGNLTSLCFDTSSRQLLASFRCSSKYPYARHQLCKMISTSNLGGSQSIEEICTSSTVHTVKAGKTQATLSRSTLFHTSEEADRLLICGSGNTGLDESSTMVHTWDSSNGQRLQKLACDGVPSDIKPLNINNNKYLAALGDKQVKLFRYNPPAS